MFWGGLGCFNGPKLSYQKLSREKKYYTVCVHTTNSLLYTEYANKDESNF